MMCFILATDEEKNCKRPKDDCTQRVHFNFNDCDEKCHLSC